MRTLVVLASSFLLAAPALAQTSETATAAEQQAANQNTANSSQGGNGERQICRRVESATGTRLGNNRRVCMTAREWRAYDRNN